MPVVLLEFGILAAVERILCAFTNYWSVFKGLANSMEYVCGFKSASVYTFVYHNLWELIVIKIWVILEQALMQLIQVDQLVNDISTVPFAFIRIGETITNTLINDTPTLCSKNIVDSLSRATLIKYIIALGMNILHILPIVLPIVGRIAIFIIWLLPNA